MKTILVAFHWMILTCLPIFINAQQQQPMIGQIAPAFTLTSLDGKSYSLEQLRGKYVVMHFATTWCPFCNAEAPYLEQLYQTYRNKGVQVLIIDVKEDKNLIEKWLQRFKLSFPVLLDENGTIATSYAPEGLQPDLARHEVPIASNLIIDKEGKIRFYSLLNTTNFDAKLVKLRQKLEELLSKEK
jgi:peroxiredoxin